MSDYHDKYCDEEGCSCPEETLREEIRSLTNERDAALEQVSSLRSEVERLKKAGDRLAEHLDMSKCEGCIKAFAAWEKAKEDK